MDVNTHMEEEKIDIQEIGYLGFLGKSAMEGAFSLLHECQDNLGCAIESRNSRRKGEAPYSLSEL